MSATRLRIVNHSELDSHWNWLATAMHGDAGLEWQHVTSKRDSSAVPLVGTTWRRVAAAREAVARTLQAPRAMLVSHGPRPAMYAAFAGGQQLEKESFHLAFSFNFTHLPQGWRRSVMAKAFQRVHRFTVSSTLERDLYARVFDLDPARIDMLHWSVQPYDGTQLAPVVADTRYICAVGSQARDYAVLLEAMRLMPEHHLHLVATPANLAGLSVPANVTVHTGVSFDFCAALVKHASVMALPLQGAEVPCGHVTAVMAMHLGTPIVATDSLGLHDYLRHDETALLCCPREPRALRDAVLTLLESGALASRLGGMAQAFAQTHCVEKRAVAYLRSLIEGNSADHFREFPRKGPSA